MADTVFVKSEDGDAPKFEYFLDGHWKVMSNSLYSQWLQGTFCDLEIKTCEGFSIRAHTCLLAAFSPKIATALSNSDGHFGAKHSVGTNSLDVKFSYEIFRPIVEAAYSGLFTTDIKNLRGLLEALQWLEMQELVDVVKYVQEKAEKENLISPEIKEQDDFEGLHVTPHNNTSLQAEDSPLEAESPEEAIRKERRPPRVTKPVPLLAATKKSHKRVKRRKNRKCFWKPPESSTTEAEKSGPNIKVVVSLINDVPYIFSLNDNGEINVPEDMKANEEDGKFESCGDEVGNSLSSEKESTEVLLPHVDNNLVDLNGKRISQQVSQQKISDKSQFSGDTNSPTLRKMLEGTFKASENTSYGTKRKKSTQQQQEEEALNEDERPPKSSRRKGPDLSVVRSQRLRRNRKKNYTAADDVPSSKGFSDSSEERDEEQEKTQAGISMAKMQGESPEAGHIKPAQVEEMEQEFFNGKATSIKCYKCFSPFTDVDEYTNHMQNHPTYTCENCHLVFYSRSYLCRHIRGDHLKTIHLKCFQCGFKTDNDKEFGQHGSEVHQESMPFKCLFKDCEFRTAKYRNLSSHFESHENIPSYMCDKCHKVFLRSRHLSHHKKHCAHIGKYLCDFCGQSFNHASYLLIHKRTVHLGEKPHQCKVCPKRFSNAANLRRHMRIHDNTFPYSCHFCLKPFRHSNTLKLHMSKHQEETNDGNPVDLSAESFQDPSGSHQ